MRGRDVAVVSWSLLGAALAWNYREHLNGRPTICSTTRAHVPPAVFLTAYPLGAVALGVHVWRGYRPTS